MTFGYRGIVAVEALHKAGDSIADTILSNKRRSLDFVFCSKLFYDEIPWLRGGIRAPFFLFFYR